MNLVLDTNVQIQYLAAQRFYGLRRSANFWLKMAAMYCFLMNKLVGGQYPP
jgi:hypothetical protein